MSKLVKLKLASRESLARFLPSRMASAGTSTEFASTEPEAPHGGPKPGGIEAVQYGRSPNPVANERRVSETKTTADAAAPSENLGREIVTYGVQSKKSELPKATVEEPEEILELKTPGFVRVFGCDSCEDSDTEIRQGAHNSSSEASDDNDESPHHGSHLPPHLTPVVHLRVPMKNKDDVRKVVAALQIKGVLEVACDLDNQVVKVTGNADPDRLLKKVKKVKRKSRLISYSNPSEMPESNPHSERPPPPGYAFVRPAYEERFRPPPQPHIFSRDFRGPFVVPPPHVRPAAQARHFSNEAPFHHHPPNVRPPPPHGRSPRPAAFYRDDSSFHDYIPRPPSSPPHYRSNPSFYPERSPPLRRSTSPPRRRSYHHAPPFRPPPMPFPGGGPPSRHRSSPWAPGVPSCMDDIRQVPDRMMHMYH